MGLHLLEVYVSITRCPQQDQCTHTHNVDIGNVCLIKQHLYQVNIIKLEKLRQGVHSMSEKDIIEPSQSSWASQK